MLKKRLFVRPMLLLVLSLTMISFQGIDAQKNEKNQLTLSAIQEGNRQIPESEWGNLKFNLGDPLYISFNLSNTGVSKVYYRVLLDSQIIESGLLENSLTLKDLAEGVHILKITAFSAGGFESEPLNLTFNVINPKIPNSKLVPAENKPENSFSSPYFLYILIGICIIQFAVIIIFVFKPKKQKEDSTLLQEHKQIQEDYIEVFNFNKRLKDELKDLWDYNEYLKKQKTELEANIKNLESINVNLLDQKEKLTESKRQLELLHTQKDELFAMAIHDIKNPVSAIRGYIELLNSYDLNATEQHEIMSSLVTSSENVVKLTQSMCTIIAQDRPEPTLKFAPSSMKKIIDDICNQNMSYAKAKSIKLFNRSSVGLPDVAMDEVKMQEVIENIVNNAIKYGPPDATVEVRTFIKNKMLTVEVQDTGVGIPEADLKRAFQKGAILTPKPTGVEQSSGLGLWIVKRIIEEHNGKVWVNSKVGTGSTFGFELPIEIKDRKATLY
jgi:signal transduction histidine kinase